MPCVAMPMPMGLNDGAPAPSDEDLDVCGDGSCLKTTVVVGERYWRRPAAGDEVVATYTVVRDGEILASAQDSAFEIDAAGAVPGFVHAAIKTMATRERARLALRAYGTSDAAGAPRPGGPATCEVTLSATVAAEAVAGAEGVLKKVLEEDRDSYDRVRPLDLVRLTIREGADWLARGARADAGVERLYSGRARDLGPPPMAAALGSLGRGETALFKFADGRVSRVRVDGRSPVIDCSADEDESVLKTELKAGEGGARPEANARVRTRIASEVALDDDDDAPPRDIEGVALDATSDWVDLAAIDDALRAAVREMSRGEVARVESQRGDCVARFRVTLVDFRNFVRCGRATTRVEKMVLEAAPAGAGECPAPLDTVTLDVESVDVEGGSPRARAGPLPTGTTTFVLDDDDAPVCEGLEVAILAMRPGERSVVRALNGPGVSRGATLRVTARLVDVERRTRCSLLEPAEKVDRAADEKERGNAAFNGGRRQRAARRYGGALDCLAGCAEATATLDAGRRASWKALKVACHVNRAAVFLADGAPGKCRADCDAALALDPANVKALYRRGSRAVWNPNRFKIRFNASVPERTFGNSLSGRRGTTGSLQTGRSLRNRGKRVQFDGGREF